jgi:hypothetical protein
MELRPGGQRLFLHHFPYSATHYEGSGLAVVPRHQVSVRHLATPNLRAERRIDNAVRTVWVRITVLGVDLLNPCAGPQRGGRLQRVRA